MLFHILLLLTAACFLICDMFNVKYGFKPRTWAQHIVLRIAHFSLRSICCIFQELKISCSNPELITGIDGSHQGEFGVRCLSADQSQAVVLRASDEGIRLVKDLPGVSKHLPT